MNSFFPIQQTACLSCGAIYFVVKLELMNPQPRPKWFAGTASWFTHCQRCLIDAGVSAEEIAAHKARRYDMGLSLSAAAG